MLQHRIGDSSRHEGSHWIKFFSIIDKLFVHYAELPNPKDVEHKLIEAFAAVVSRKIK